MQFAESDIFGIDGLGVFDLVVCSNVLNFLNNSNDLRLGVEKLCKLTGEGGKLAIWSAFRGLREAYTKVPLADFAPFWLRRLLVKVFKVDSYLSSTRSPGFSEVRKILEENGLDVELPLKRLGWRKVLGIHRSMVAAKL